MRIASATSMICASSCASADSAPRVPRLTRPRRTALARRMSAHGASRRSTARSRSRPPTYHCCSARFVSAATCATTSRTTGRARFGARRRASRWSAASFRHPRARRAASARPASTSSRRTSIRLVRRREAGRGDWRAACRTLSTRGIVAPVRAARVSAFKRSRVSTISRQVASTPVAVVVFAFFELTARQA